MCLWFIKINRYTDEFQDNNKNFQKLTLRPNGDLMLQAVPLLGMKSLGASTKLGSP